MSRLFGCISAFLAVVWLSCGGTDPSTQPPSGPWVGTAGNALIGDNTGNLLWVGFNSSATWQQFLSLRSQHGNNGGFWIGGHVVPDGTAPLGFFFDPSTTQAAEVTAEGAQTTLGFIKADPNHFATAGFGNPILWYVPAVIQQVSNQ
jgi:hypothetical protein